MRVCVSSAPRSASSLLHTTSLSPPRGTSRPQKFYTHFTDEDAGGENFFRVSQHFVLALTPPCTAEREMRQQ